jgi:predicted nucleic acid-binding protein
MVKNMILIDACVFIRILLQEPGSDDCEDYLNEINNRGDIICVTAGIIHEILKRIEEKVDSDAEKANAVQRTTYFKFRNDDLFSHLNALKGLLSEGKIIFMPEGKEGKRIFDSCMGLRFGKIENTHWDRFHLAFAISNNCSEFVTTDREIYDATKNIREVSINNNLKITLVGH